MQFEIIGADNENYFLMAFDKQMVMNKGVFFYKIPLSFFDFIDMEQPLINTLIDVEVYVSTYYEELIEDGLLTNITKRDFMHIDIIYKGD